MTRIQQLVCCVGILILGAADVAADTKTDSPRSLHMRTRPQRHVAQAGPDPQPAGDTPSAGDAPPPLAPEPEPATPSAAGPGPVGSPPAGPTPPSGPVAPVPELTAAEVSKLAEGQATPEVHPATGSLIDRGEAGELSPVTVVDRERITGAGLTNLGEVLQKLPAQGNALNAQNNLGGDGSTRINLRGLGTGRTLVLLNGRRVVASGLGADSSVDLGTIPLAMVERVEVLPDGAAAIYGSDAVAGVVNLITRSNVNGTDASVYTSTSQQGGGTDYDLSFVSGRTSAKGNITLSAGYQKQSPVMARDRPFSAQNFVYQYTCSAAAIAAGTCVVGGTALSASIASPTGFIDTLDATGHKAFTPPGCTADICTADTSRPGFFRDFVLPTATQFNDGYNFQGLNYLITPSTHVNLFSNGSYELANDTQAFFEASFNSRRSAQQIAEQPLITSQLGANGIVISKDSIYNPFGVDIADYDRRLTEFGPRTADQDIETSRLVVGLKGKIPQVTPMVKNWTWEASYNYGRSTSTNTLHGDLIVSRLSDALGPSFQDANGLHCGTPSNPIIGCVPLNLLVPGQATRDAIDNLAFAGIQSGLDEQHMVQVTASGKLVDLPNHGDISVAVGGDYRFERGASTPDALTATGDTTGFANAPIAGAYHTFEGFGELSIVPVSGLAYLNRVELDAAGRAYDYSSSGSGVTGELRALLRTAGGITVHGTYGTAFRAPAIAELYTGHSDSFVSIPDPCRSGIPPVGTTALECQKQGVVTPPGQIFPVFLETVKNGGNPQLHPETATIGTAGVLFQPLGGLDVTLDYWHVRIDDVIQTLPAATILARCYDAGIQQFCDEIQRDPTSHALTTIVDLPQNVSSLTTSGLDLSAAYQYSNGYGTFRHALEGTYLFKYNLDNGAIDPLTGKDQIVHGKGFYDLGVNPDLKFNLFATWSHRLGLGAGINVRFVDSFQECQQDNCNKGSNLRREVASYATGDLFFSYTLNSRQGTTNVSIGMNNFVDARPPAIYNGPGLNADASAYDFMGRQFYVRLGQRF